MLFIGSHGVNVDVVVGNAKDRGGVGAVHHDGSIVSQTLTAVVHCCGTCVDHLCGRGSFALDVGQLRGRQQGRPRANDIQISALRQLGHL